MIKNHLKSTLRNLLKNKTHSIINIGGLTLGIVCTLVIFLIIQFDLSFDTWQQDRERLYRVVQEDGTRYSVGTPYLMAEYINEDISGIEYISLVDTDYNDSPTISYEQEGNIRKIFREDNLAFVEPEYFNIMSYEWLKGDKLSAINRPNTAVITMSFAKKMFGDIDIIGKNLTIQLAAAKFKSPSVLDIEITGVVDDAPENSDFPFNIFVASNSKNQKGIPRGDGMIWYASPRVQVYVKLNQEVNKESIDAQFESILKNMYQDDYNPRHLPTYFLQPLSEIHFDANFENYNNRTGDLNTLTALGIIGLLLLITACINFININTAVAVSRSKEVGLRKTLGGTKAQLTLLFLGETAFITLIALILSIGITEIVLINIESILGFSLNSNLLTNIPALIFLGVLFVIVTLAAGWYPANYLSSFNPIEAIRNRINNSYGKGITLRRVLITHQFIIAQALIICTIIIVAQIHYMQNQELGFQKEAIIEVPLPSRDNQLLETFKTTLLNQTSINNVSFSNSGILYNNIWRAGGALYNDDNTSTGYGNNSEFKVIDSDFIDTYGLTLLAGTNLVPADTLTGFLVNESYAIKTGFGDDYSQLIGKTSGVMGYEAPIVGIVKDFNSNSLHNDIAPTTFISGIGLLDVAGININTSQISEAIANIEQTFSTLYPNHLFEYTFIDDKISSMYKEEQRTIYLMNAFSIIAIIIGSLGLFGLVSYMATTRIKEIGVRKVLGASIVDILKIFGTELSYLIGISFIIASPLSWYLMQQWLEDFAYKIDIGIEIFLLALGGTLFLSVITVGYKSISAALSNPIDSLTSE